MESLEKEVKKFLKTVDTIFDDYIGCGYSSGNGYGYGDGYGKGHSSGRGDIWGSGYGCGNAFSADLSCGDGSGAGLSCGAGARGGYGYGNDYNCENKIKSINGHLTYDIDDTLTIVYSIHGNIARGAIIMSDLSAKKCYVVKGQNKFSHGETIKGAMQSLQEKIFEDMDTDEAIEEFKKHFSDLNKKYKASEFYTWHHILTGSCEMGRKTFAQNHGIDLDKDKFTIKEFINLTKNDYGGSIIMKLEESYAKGVN